MANSPNLNLNLSNSSEGSKDVDTWIDGLTGTATTSNMMIIDTAVGNKLDKTGDSSANTETFTEATTRTNIATGDTHATLFGKIHKFFTDLGTAAFKAVEYFATATHTHTKSDITDFPSSLPANGGNADTVDNKHATDFTPCVGEAKIGLLDGSEYYTSHLLAKQIGFYSTSNSLLSIPFKSADGVLRVINIDSNKTLATTDQIPTSSSYVPLLSNTVGTSAQSISIDLSGVTTSNYIDLIVYAQIFTSNDTTINCTVNHLTSYYGNYLKSAETPVNTLMGSASFGNFASAATTASASNPCPIRISINNSHLNIGSTSTHSTACIEFDGGCTQSMTNGNTFGYVNITTSSDISSIQFIATAGNISIGSIFYVYGVKK